MGRLKTPALTFAYLLSIVSANLLVKHFGAYGLWFSSFFLIPFDFVIRCYFQEKLKNSSQVFIFFFLTTLFVSVITMWFNAVQIAYASGLGFGAAALTAGVYYHLNRSKSWFYKVNISDLLAIVSDSVVFQLIAFGALNPLVTIGQVVIKFTGGLLWYFILFKRLKIQSWIISNK